MIQTFFLCLLLIYYWYFYTWKSTDVKKPATGSPSKAEPLKFTFDSYHPNHFRFVIDDKWIWDHILQVDAFTVYENKIVAVDPCHGSKDGDTVPVKGKILYDYLNDHPNIKDVSKFNKNSQFTVQQGDVFYFNCLNGRVESLDMCPSGTKLENGRCETITRCTDKPNGTTFPHPTFLSKYISCLDGKERISVCPDKHLFNYNRCEPKSDLTHFCKMHPHEWRLINDVTLIKCRNGSNVFVTCKPGTRFFDKPFCEPDNCAGLPDGTRLPLPQRKLNLFQFVPGYMTCHQDKIRESVECPKTWDEMLSKGDNLTFLPMVFDGQTCSVPTFCENVFSDDPETIVPLHEFTKHVKNWKLSELFDHSSGFECENNVRKRKVIPVDSRVSKRFKVEPACDPSMPNHLPIYGHPDHYYDCESKSLTPCPDSKFFNGSTCIERPQKAFTFNNIPFFQFDSLNEESWIKAWDYSKEPKTSCPDATYNKLYNICSDPDCEKYAFISQIPELAIHLPFEQRAKCKYYEAEKTIKKEPVDYKYQFWNQRKVDERHDETCEPGGKLQSGNLIWDSTIFTTCNMDQPFIFCPSTHSQGIIQIDHDGKHFACAPPIRNSFIFDHSDWFLFETNEIKRVLPTDSTGDPTTIRLNKRNKEEILPLNGLKIPDNQKLNMLTNKPVELELHYRVTHPPNVSFEYIDNNDVEYHYTTPNHAFLTKIKNFTDKHLTFPRYTPIKFVDDFNSGLYV